MATHQLNDWGEKPCGHGDLEMVLVGRDSLSLIEVESSYEF